MTSDNMARVNMASVGWSSAAPPPWQRVTMSDQCAAVLSFGLAAQAGRGGGNRLQPLGRNRVAAVDAASVGSSVHASERLVDLFDGAFGQRIDASTHVLLLGHDEVFGLPAAVRDVRPGPEDLRVEVGRCVEQFGTQLQELSPQCVQIEVAADVGGCGRDGRAGLFTFGAHGGDLRPGARQSSGADR